MCRCGAELMRVIVNLERPQDRYSVSSHHFENSVFLYMGSGQRFKTKNLLHSECTEDTLTAEWENPWKDAEQGGGDEDE